MQAITLTDLRKRGPEFDGMCNLCAHDATSAIAIRVDLLLRHPRTGQRISGVAIGVYCERHVKEVPRELLAYRSQIDKTLGHLQAPLRDAWPRPVPLDVTR